MLGMNVPEKSALWLVEKTQLAYKIEVKKQQHTNYKSKKRYHIYQLADKQSLTKRQ